MRLRPLEAGRAGSARPPMARYGTLWQAHPRARSGSSVHASVNSPVLESASRSAFRCLLASSQPCRSPHGQASARPLRQDCPRLELPVFPIRPRPAHTPALTLPIRISPTSAHGSQNAPSGGHPSLRQTRPLPSLRDFPRRFLFSSPGTSNKLPPCLLPPLEVAQPSSASISAHRPAVSPRERLLAREAAHRVSRPY